MNTMALQTRSHTQLHCSFTTLHITAQNIKMCIKHHPKEPFGNTWFVFICTIILVFMSVSHAMLYVQHYSYMQNQHGLATSFSVQLSLVMVAP